LMVQSIFLLFCLPLHDLLLILTPFQLVPVPNQTKSAQLLQEPFQNRSLHKEHIADSDLFLPM
jgi:hypothetical protein